jgi:hypothetical protein
MSAPPVPASQKPDRLSRFPFLLSVFFGLCLGFLVGGEIGLITGSVVASVVLDNPLWKSADIRFAEYLIGSVVGFAVWIGAFLALWRPRFRPLASGFIAVGGVAFVAIPAGALTFLGVWVLFKVSGMYGYHLAGHVSALIVGTIVGIVFNTYAMRWCARRFAPKV